MQEKYIALIGGGNAVIFIAALGEWLKFGTQVAAFCATSLSFCLLVYRERDTIRQMFRRGEGSK